jgi:chemosensory pili system protein ChpA (sensor histidine kinase/response regulator)
MNFQDSSKQVTGAVNVTPMPHRNHQGPPVIMIVEDDADSRLMMKTLLEMKGYSVVEAWDGQVAIEVAERERPQLVIMDLQLPRMHGFAVARYMRQHADLCLTPIVIMSGHDPLYHRPLALAAGCNEYLNKPLDFDLLELTLSRWAPLH